MTETPGPKKKSEEDWLDKKIKKMEDDPDSPLTGVNDNGKPERYGAIPPKRDDITSGRSGGHTEPDSDLGDI
jgi:hypothetical protein